MCKTLVHGSKTLMTGFHLEKGMAITVSPADIHQIVRDRKGYSRISPERSSSLS